MCTLSEIGKHVFCDFCRIQNNFEFSEIPVKKCGELDFRLFMCSVNEYVNNNDMMCPFSLEYFKAKFEVCFFLDNGRVIRNGRVV